MIDPVQVVEAFAKSTSGITIPTTVPTLTPNPNVPSFEQAGETGSKVLWIVFVIMFLSSLAFFYLAYVTPVQKRLFHILTAFITTFATISYFAMATGSGNSFAEITETHSHHSHPDTVVTVFRQVFYARYIDWTVTTPLLLLDLAFLAGLNGANILVAVVADILMIILGVMAAYGKTEGQKWALYAMSNAAFLVIIYQLAIPGRRAVASKDNKTATLFASIGAFTLILWVMYPIVWGISDGARMWSVDAEIMAYAVLDVLAKPVFGFWLLFAHGKGATAIEGFWSNGLGQEGSLRIGDDDE